MELLLLIAGVAVGLGILYLICWLAAQLAQTTSGAAVGLGILYLIWRGLRGLADFLENDGPDYHDGEW